MPGTNRSQFLLTQQPQGVDAAAAGARAVEGHVLSGLGFLQQLGIEIGEDVFQQLLEIVLAGARAALGSTCTSTPPEQRTPELSICSPTNTAEGVCSEWSR